MFGNRTLDELVKAAIDTIDTTPLGHQRRLPVSTRELATIMAADEAEVQRLVAHHGRGRSATVALVVIWP